MIDGPQHLTGYPLRDYDDLITALAASRADQNLTYAQLAEQIADRSAHSTARISRWLLGATVLPARGLVALADALGYDLALIPRQAAVFPRPKRPDGRYRCSQPGHTACTCPETDPETAPASTESTQTTPAHGHTYTWTRCDLDGHHGCTPRECQWADDYPLQETHPGSGTNE